MRSYENSASRIYETQPLFLHSKKLGIGIQRNVFRTPHPPPPQEEPSQRHINNQIVNMSVLYPSWSNPPLVVP